MNMTKSIRFVLTDHERIDRGSRLAQILSGIEEEKEAAKSDAQRHKARIQEFTEEARKLQHAVHTGEEFRDVQVREERDEKRGHINIVRIDTGAVVDSRAMTGEERQTPIDFEKSKGINQPAATAKESREPAAPKAEKKPAAKAEKKAAALAPSKFERKPRPPKAQKKTTEKVNG